MRRLIAILLLPLALSGCVPLLVAGGTETGISLAEDRSLGRKVDDNVIYTDITNVFIKEDKAAILKDVTFNIRYGRVMLTGTVKSEDVAQQAVALTWQAKGVQEVINELVVNPNFGFFDTANDAFIKKNLESRLLLTKDVWVINYSIDVQNGTAFLIGRVKDQAELDRVLNVARHTRGVKRVVTHLQISTDSQNATHAPAGNGAEVSTGASSSNRPANTGSGGYGGATIVNTSPSYNATTSGTVDAPASVSSGDLPPPAAH